MTDTNMPSLIPSLPRIEFDSLDGIRERLFAKLLKRAPIGSLTVELPGGRHLRQLGSEGPAAKLIIHSKRGLGRLFGGGHNGFAEAYMDGDLDIECPTGLFLWFLANEPTLRPGTRGTLIARVMDRIAHLLKPNSKSGSKKNISAHYDLGNSFYGTWLDSTMSYSSAIFEDMAEPMEQAQLRKIDTALEALQLSPGDSLLEIGCGWGGVLERAVTKHGLRPRGITISAEQLAFTKNRLAPFSAADVAVFEDYRDTEGQFDGIISIEMFEAVGEANWPTYFQTLYDRLKPGGRAVIQVITIDHDRYKVYRNGADFIQRYIFPGGMLPSPERFAEEADQAGLAIEDFKTFGKSYAETLRRWRTRFEETWTDIEPLGFDERFRRMWRYYLTYCEAGFDHGSIDVAQYTLVK